ncbi:hypothetical protein [Shimia aestuarii]|uniref:Uncharacterized protein n=1 Tax=Shimia aestuarii TaxID=254406 RepID=A0A1I4PX77_9RHOB|nr:hypothetical protein [Shimia aestuarii]SFM32417.1 hypothetical protein SAMN04488042_10686 [Shimia aestuarii]
MSLIGPNLIGAACARSVSAFAASLPDVASGHVLECRLGEAGGICDYSFVLSRGNGGLDRFAAFVPEDPFWSQTAEVIRSAEGALVDAGLIWLEVDFGAKEPSRPSFFVSHGPDLRTRAERFDLARALAGVFDVSLRDALDTLMRKLPEPVAPKQAGIMAGRSGRQLRLVLDGIKVSQVCAMLARIGWPGHARSLVRVSDLARQLAGDASCRVDLDLDERVAPSVGLELGYPALTDPERVVRCLEAEGLCTPDTGSALHLAMSRRTLAKPRTGGRIDFGLNHLKLGLRSAAADIQAKAYFSLVNLPDFQGNSV